MVVDSLTFGTGVSLEKLQSLRDPILQLRIQQETQQQGQLDAFVTAMQQAQVLFSGSSTDIGTQISNFFGSLNQLSTDPTNLSLRQGVLTAAGNLANTFRSAASNLTSQRNNLDPNVVQGVQQVNALTSQIAQLNGQIANLQNLNQDASALVDKRDVLIGQTLESHRRFGNQERQWLDPHHFQRHRVGGRRTKLSLDYADRCFRCATHLLAGL